MCISLTKTNPHGCPKCADKKAGLLRIRTLKQFKQEVRICHGDEILVLGKYIKSKTPIEVTCTSCNHIWSPSPDNLIGISPHGCPKCKAAKLGLLNTKSEKVFKRQLKKIHAGHIKLISEYSKQGQDLQFKCSKEHIWWSKYAVDMISPTRRQGCPQCGNIVSKGEAKLFKFIKRIAPDAQQSVRITKDPRTGGMLEWDIYVPSKSIAIEYNGIYFHSYPKKDKDYHAMKSQQSLSQHSVRVIHVTDLEWKCNTKVVKKTLKHILGTTENRYFARKLKVVKRERLTSVRRAFYQKNHLQGDPTNGISYALVRDDGAIVALMSFAPVQSVRGTVKEEGKWELVRYATKGSVVGGASRLFTAFLREYSPTYILSYSQNDWFDGSIYPLLGFTKIKNCGHDYRTLWGNELRHKSYTRRSNLQKLLGSNFDPVVSEQQNLINNKVPILYDSGKIKWEWAITY
jgi:ssDNA-binding Zn-finger/Zn-ribbon topoisomerase 1